MQAGGDDEAPYQQEDDHPEHDATTHTLLLTRAADADDDEEWNGDYQAGDFDSSLRDANDSGAGHPTLPQAWDSEANSLADQLQEAERTR
jgi:hypothetical protein